MFNGGVVLAEGLAFVEGLVLDEVLILDERLVSRTLSSMMANAQ